MRIRELRIKNYRCFDDVTIDFEDYTCFVGCNGAGKSTVLSALNVLFREKEGAPTDVTVLDSQDFHCGRTELPIEISATFHSLSDSAKVVLKDYVRQGLFVSGQEFERIRLFQRLANRSSAVTKSSFQSISDRVAAATGEQLIRPTGTRARLHQALLYSMSEMFFCARLVLVEGTEDAAYITSYLSALDLWDGFRGKGGHIVAVGGKSKLIEAFAIATQLNIPTYLVFDADGYVQDQAKRAKHERDNRSLLRMLNREDDPPFPDADRIEPTFAMFSEELGSSVRASIGDAWSALTNEACLACGSVGDVKKNALYIAELTSGARERGLQIESLERLSVQLRAFTGF